MIDRMITTFAICVAVLIVIGSAAAVAGGLFVAITYALVIKAMRGKL